MGEETGEMSRWAKLNVCKLGCSGRHTQYNEEAQSLRWEWATCCSWGSGCKCSKYEERKGSQKKNEQPPTGAILAYAERDKSEEKMHQSPWSSFFNSCWSFSPSLCHLSASVLQWPCVFNRSPLKPGQFQNSGYCTSLSVASKEFMTLTLLAVCPFSAWQRMICTSFSWSDSEREAFPWHNQKHSKTLNA